MNCAPANLLHPGGRTRTEVQQKYNVNVDFPKMDVIGPARSQVKISGLPENVARARDLEKRWLQKSPQFKATREWKEEVSAIISDAVNLEEELESGRRALSTYRADLDLEKAELAGYRDHVEGDIRSVLVAAEWVAHKLRTENPDSLRLTRNWLEQRVLADPGGGSFFKGMNRGGVRDIVDRVFTEGAGFPEPPIGAESMQDPYDRSANVAADVASIKKRHAISRLREMVDASGDHDRCTTECFSSYPLQQYQDDTFLSKPNEAYDWLHFHDTLSSRVYSAHDWELGAYLSQATSAFHLLFATAQGKTQLQYKDKDDEEEEEEHPFSGPRAEFAAFEATKQNQAILSTLQSSFSPPLLRLFRSPDNLATELIPNVIRMLSPDVKPVVVRGAGSDQRTVASVRKESERLLVQAAVRVMGGLGVTFEKVRIENEGAHGGFAYRMEP